MFIATRGYLGSIAKVVLSGYFTGSESPTVQMICASITITPRIDGTPDVVEC